VRDRAGAEVHLFSDGAAAELGDFERETLNVVYHRFGQRSDNRGIVTLDVRSHPENPAQRAVFVSVANASSNAAATELELLFDGRLIEARALELAARETVPQVFTATQEKDGVFTCRLAGKDDLAADNQASIASLLPQPAKVLLVTKGNGFLEKALRAVPSVDLAVANDSADEAREYDLTVLDDVAPSVWPAGNLLAIRCARTNWLDVLGPVEGPPVVDWKNTHPLLRFVSFDNVGIDEALGVKLPPWATPLVESPNTPLVLAGEIARQRVVWIGFSLLHSSWPLRISFPIFIANAVEWLNPATANAAQLQVRAGDPIRFALTTPLTNASIKLPDGSLRPAAVDTVAGELVFGDTHRQGLYQLETGPNKIVFCVNLLDPNETDTTPRAELRLGKYTRARATTVRQANLELWRWIAAAGLALLLFEWWYYHRRTA